MIVFVLKMYFRKLQPRIISHRDFSYYDNANFINPLNEVLSENENTESFLKDPDYFYKVCTEVLNQHAPLKKNYVPENNKPFMNNKKDKLLKYPATANRTSYSKQRNFYGFFLLRKEMKKIFCQSQCKKI